MTEKAEKTTLQTEDKKMAGHGHGVFGRSKAWHAASASRTITSISRSRWSRCIFQIRRDGRVVGKRCRSLNLSSQACLAWSRLLRKYFWTHDGVAIQQPQPP